MASWRLRSYRKLAKRAERFFWARLSGKAAAKGRAQDSLRLQNEPDLPGEAIWFHASSQGELEVLWPVVREVLLRDAQLRVAVSVYSPSARGSLGKRVLELEQSLLGRVVFAGYAPHEGDWSAAFKRAQVCQVVSCKYEAWPDLWASAAERGARLTIVAASDRKSLRTVRALLGWLGASVPEIEFLCIDDQDQRSLKGWAGKARIAVIGDPRWDRLKERKAKSSSRVEDLVRMASDRGRRPWGIVGSAWEADFVRILAPALSHWKGTLWVVPHQLGAEELTHLETQLKKLGRETQRTTLIDNTRGFDTLLVDEMGILAELYAHMDWAYVGGGFGKGVHSTMEPAVSALPIACGPARTETFTEVRQLSAKGMLTVVRTKEEFERWLGRVSAGEFVPMRNDWFQWLGSRYGAAERTAKLLLEPSGTR